MTANRKIVVRAAVGRGSTTMAAFDHALLQVGAGNYNLVRLSSVIPPGSQVVTEEAQWDELQGVWGDRLYSVYAAHCSRQPHDRVWAGLGWVQATDGDGSGLFVEHEGHSEDEVEGLLRASLADMCNNRSQEFDEAQTLTIGVRCRDGEAVCALVIALYNTMPWNNNVSVTAYRSG